MATDPVHLARRVRGLAGRIFRRLDPRHRMLRRESHAFDAARGIDTARIVSLDDLTIASGPRDSGFIYVPTGERVFSAFVGMLPGEPAGYTFVDLGSGKGRTLILAAEAGFPRAVGVEFAAELHAAAEDNVARWAARHPTSGVEIDCVEGDAGAFSPPPGPLVIYLHNPFAEDVMERVLANVRASLAAAPREIWFWYLQLRREDPGDETRNVQLIASSGLVDPRRVPRGGLVDRIVMSPFDLRAFVTRPAG